MAMVEEAEDKKRVKKKSIISLRKEYPFLTMLSDAELAHIRANAPVYKRREYFRYVFDKEYEARMKGKQKTFKLRRLWNNIASIRDYNLQECLDKGIGIRIEVEGEEGAMEYDTEQVKQFVFQAHQTKNKSRYGTKEYTLVDFQWKPNEDTKERESDNG